MELKIFDKSFDALERKMDLAMKRHLVLSSNIANAETPNYRAREVDFAGALQQALGDDSKNAISTTNRNHIGMNGSGIDHVIFDNSAPMGADGNNVDLDIAMGKASNNARLYENSVNLLQMKLRLLRMATAAQPGM